MKLSGSGAFSAIILAMTCPFTSAQGAVTRQDDAAQCAALASAAIPNGAVQSATFVGHPAVFQHWRGPVRVAEPFCRVQLSLKPTERSDIGVEIWLPIAERWNGKFLGTGNGSAAGAITYPELQDGLRRGYAVANTDMGTKARRFYDFSFGRDEPEAVKDWGFRATHLMTQAGKSLVTAFYGQAAGRSYCMGCSTGGAQGMAEVQRFPDDYDGVVAGASAHDRIALHTVGTWNYRVLHADPSSFITTEKFQMVTDHVVATCDGQDGVIDGVIDDPRRCEIDLARLQCMDGDGPGCLTAPQLIALRALYAGPFNPRTGAAIYPGFALGGEGGPPDGGFTAAAVSTKPSNGGGLLRWTPWRGAEFDFDHDLAALKVAFGPSVDFIDPDLTPFEAKGGKLIIYQGWLDRTVPPQGVVDYFEGVRATMGQTRTDAFARLFMAPGMGHCHGGSGPDQFDALGALELWVEKGQPPATLIATRRVKGEVNQTRPLCAYPKMARWAGRGSTDLAENFICQPPGGSRH